MRDELRATGGSLYYLSHRDVVEGSEQVTLVVRDKNTGSCCHAGSAAAELDYTVKYPEGRMMFHAADLERGRRAARSSTRASLPGNPVFDPGRLRGDRSTPSRRPRTAAGCASRSATTSRSAATYVQGRARRRAATS